VVLCFIPTASATAFLGFQAAGAFAASGYEETRGKDATKILSVLAVRSAGGEVLGKAAEKLSVMNAKDIRLISSLCDPISADRGTAGADIASSLVTALIMVS
jgi:hypothetical protein